MVQEIEFEVNAVNLLRRVSLPIGSFGYSEYNGKVAVFLLNREDEHWTIANETYDQFKERLNSLI